MNLYKLKKQWGRRLGHVRDEVIPSSVMPSSRHDFAWKKRKQNPFFSSSEKTSLFTRTKRQLLILFFLSFVTSCLGLLLLHPFFQIKHIIVEGPQRIHSRIIEEVVEGILKKKIIYIFSGTNYFLIPEIEIKEIILSRFPLQQVTVIPVFPDTVRIVLEEKIPVAIYDNEKQYFYIDIEGKVIEPLRFVTDDEWYVQKNMVTSTIMVTTTLFDGTETSVVKEIQVEREISRTHVPPTKKIATEFGVYPIIFDDRQREGAVNTIVFEPQSVKSIISWVTLLSTYTDLDVSFISVDSTLGDATIKIKDGWELRIRLSTPPEDQFNELQTILKNSIDSNKLQYIDLRFPGRVYWQ